MAQLELMFVASEAAPLAKTGGLGDVAGALPAALSRLGPEVCLVLPAYQHIDKTGLSRISLPGMSAWAGQDWPLEAWHGRLRGHDLYLLGSPLLFDRPGLYSDQHGDYPDNLTRFSFFCRAVIKLSQALNLRPRALHVNDWQSALLPAILNTRAVEPNPLDQARTVLTIHNLAYQGIFPLDQYHLTGLPTHFRHMEGMEFWGNLSLLKAGIVCADAITTVSPTYAREIMTPELGHGMDGILRGRGQVLSGIVNGVEYELWSPESDPLLPANYSVDCLGPKKRCRDHLLRQAALPPAQDQPVLGMVGRIAYQKGIDILAPALRKLLAEHDLRLVILGSGEPYYEQMIRDLAQRHAGQVSFITQFSETMAHLIYGGSDMLLMPSRYEPCGLSQLYAMRYGTIPVVHATGGLVDTVSDYHGASRQGTGFMFGDYDERALISALRRALFFFRTPKVWQGIMGNAMRQDFSWDKSARQYLALYEHLLKEDQT